MTFTYPIDTDDFKAYFDRDFDYGTAKNTVRDSDITRAMSNAMMVFNNGLFDNDDEIENAFLILTAHCLVKLIGSGNGLYEGQGLGSNGSGPVSSKSGGGLSVSYSLPQQITEDPNLSDYLTTGYGRQYLAIIAPRLVGWMENIPGQTNP